MYKAILLSWFQVGAVERVVLFETVDGEGRPVHELWVEGERLPGSTVLEEARGGVKRWRDLAAAVRFVRELGWGGFIVLDRFVGP